MTASTRITNSGTPDLVYGGRNMEPRGAARRHDSKSVQTRRPAGRRRPRRSAGAPVAGCVTLGSLAGARLPREERGADRFGAQLLERADQAADARERLAVLLAQPLGLVARLHEVRDGVAVGRQPRGAQHDGADPRPQGEVTQLLDERGELAQLEDVVHR